MAAVGNGPSGGERRLLAGTRPCQPSGCAVYACRAVSAVLAAAVAAVAAVAATSPRTPLEQPCACLAFVYVVFLFCFQTWMLEWPRPDPGAWALVALAFAALLAPVLLGARAGWGALGLPSLALCAVAYRYLVRGPSCSLQAGGGGLSGRVCVVTGCNSGIGLTTAEALARAGATVVFACRSAARAEAAMQRVVARGRGGVGPEQLVFLPLDLSSSASVRAFAAKFAETGLGLHLLVLNAGTLQGSRSLSADGIELTMASNHFGNFLLTRLLLPHLRATEDRRGDRPPPRIVVVGSNMAFAHRGLDLDEAAAVATGPAEKAALLERPHNMFRVYGQSKIASALFVFELARRLRRLGSKIPVNIVHPGECLTDVAGGIHPLLLRVERLLEPLALTFLKSATQGSFCTLFVATHPDLATSDAASGLYFDRLAPTEPPEAATDEAMAAELWTVSEALTGAPPM